MNVIELKQVSKQYGDFKAVHAVDLCVPKGSIVGLIGRNGAGKSTMMKLISGQIHPSEGSFTLFGKDPDADEYTYRRIGTLIENAGFYPSMNAYDNMKIKALALGCYEDHHIRELLQICGIADTGKKKVRHFSMGMKQRLGIAMALLGNPELLILDEPTNGLDPQGINDMRTLLQRLNQEKGMTILISSHILEELSKLASHYAIIKEGRILEYVNREELQDKCQDSIYLRVDQADKAVAVLEEVLGMDTYEVVEDDAIHIQDDLDNGNIVNVLVAQRIRVQEIYMHKQNLEEYFLKKSGDSHA